MKANPTKFAKLPKLPKLQAGGFMSSLEKFGNSAAGQKAIGVGTGLFNGLVSSGPAIAQPAGNFGQSEVTAGNLMDYSGNAAQKTADKKNAREGAFGAVQGIGDMGLQSGFAPAMIAGVALKGLGALGKALGIGNGAVEEAERKQKLMQETSAQASIARQGAVNKNSIQTFKAPAYGRRGMKFKTSKFAKPC
jgi:hypothetical protein